MRWPRAVLALVALLQAAGCGARSSLPFGPPKAGSLVLRQGALERHVAPVDGDTDVVSFYGYSSASGHTGFEALGKSQLFFYRDPGGALSLVSEHGIDIDATGQAQPPGHVVQVFQGLPPGTTLAFSDEPAAKSPAELQLSSPSSARGDWTFNQNTDGGALGGLPLPGDWTVTVDAQFLQGIDTWRFFGPDEIPLSLDQTVELTATTPP